MIGPGSANVRPSGLGSPSPRFAIHFAAVIHLAILQLAAVAHYPAQQVARRRSRSALSFSLATFFWSPFAFSRAFLSLLTMNVGMNAGHRSGAYNIAHSRWR